MLLILLCLGTGGKGNMLLVLVTLGNCSRASDAR